MNAILSSNEALGAEVPRVPREESLRNTAESLRPKNRNTFNCASGIHEAARWRTFSKSSSYEF
jgi:hypothetical protein